MDNVEQIARKHKYISIKTDIKTNRVHNIRENEKIYIGNIIAYEILLYYIINHNHNISTHQLLLVLTTYLYTS